MFRDKYSNASNLKFFFFRRTVEEKNHDMRKGAKLARKRSREVTDPLDQWERLLERTKKLLAGDQEIDSLFEEPCILANTNDQKRVLEYCKQIFKEMKTQRLMIGELRESLKKVEMSALRFQRRLVEDHKRTMIGGSPHTEPNQRIHSIVYSDLTLQPIKKVKRRKKNKK